MSHQYIHARAVESRRGQNPQIPIVPEILTRLANEIDALADSIDQGHEPYDGKRRII